MAQPRIEAVGCRATFIAVQLQAITATRASILLGGPHQPLAYPLTTRGGIDTEVAYPAEIAIEGQLNDEVQGDEAEKLPILPFGHQQAGIGVT